MPVADRQFVHPHPLDEFRQPWRVEAHLGRFGAHLQTEAGLQHREHGGRGPGLRRTRHRVARRPFAGAPREAAEELGHAVLVEIQARIEQPAEHAQRLAGVAIARHAAGDQRVVVRPDRPVVVRHWVVARALAGNGANAPAAVEVAAQQRLGDAGRVRR